MDSESCPFSNYCGKQGNERACSGNQPRTVRCFHCGQSFQSRCGARLFCCGQCQEENELGRKIIDLLRSGRMEEIKKEKRKAQLHRANKNWRETPQGIAAKKAQDARRYERNKAKAAAREDAPLVLDSTPDETESPEPCDFGPKTIIPGDRNPNEFDPSEPIAEPDFDLKTAPVSIPGDQEPEKMESFFGENRPIPCARPGCGNSFDFDTHVPQKKYCSRECYDIVHLAKKRLLHWYRRTGCLYAREIYRLLRDEVRDSG